MIDHNGFTTVVNHATDPKRLPSGAYAARPHQLRIPLPELWTRCDDSVVSNESDQSGMYEIVTSPTEFPFPACNKGYDGRSTDPQSTTNHAQANSALGADATWGDEPCKGLVPQGSTQGCLPASTIPWSPVTLPDVCSSGRQYVGCGDHGETYMSTLADDVSSLSPGHIQQPDESMSPYTTSCSTQMSDSTLKSGSPPCQKQVSHFAGSYRSSSSGGCSRVSSISYRRRVWQSTQAHYSLLWFLCWT